MRVAAVKREAQKKKFNRCLHGIVALYSFFVVTTSYEVSIFGVGVPLLAVTSGKRVVSQ